MDPSKDGTIKSLKTNKHNSSKRPRRIQRKNQFHPQITHEGQNLTNQSLKFQIIKRSQVLEEILAEKRKRIIGNILKIFRQTAKFNKRMTKFGFTDKRKWCSWRKIIATKGFPILRETFKNMICLREINFCFKSSDIANKGLRQISQCLKEMPLLQKISLSFIKCFYITEKGFHSLIQSLKKFRFLKDLTFKIDNCESVRTDDVLINDISKVFTKCSSLQNLDLKLSFFKITDKSLEILAKSLRKLQLKSLLMNFEKSLYFTDLGVSILSEYLKEIVSLQKVDLDFSKCSSISYYSVYIICDALKCLPVIKKIVLWFDTRDEIICIESSETSENSYDFGSLVSPQSNNSNILKSNADSRQGTDDSDFKEGTDDSDFEEVKMMEIISKYSALPQSLSRAVRYAEDELNKTPNGRLAEVNLRQFDWEYSYSSSEIAEESDRYHKIAIKVCDAHQQKIFIHSFNDIGFDL